MIKRGLFLSLYISTAFSTTQNNLFLTVNSKLLSAKDKLGLPLNIPPDQNWQDLINPYERPTLPDGSSFDFIVVGSGSSGSALANRLSENPQWKVLLLEAGDEAPPIVDIPAITPTFQLSDLNWNYLLEKQDNVGLGLTDQRIASPKGRGIGGSSLINYMVHERGNRRDYDRWAKLGNPGWSYRDVFRYFTKSEDCRVRQQDSGYHGIGSYLSVEDVAYRTDSAKAFVKAAQELSYSYMDYNGRRQLGVSYVQATTKKGRRWSAEAAFLRNFTNRPNLVILGRSQVAKLLIDNNTRTAYGVQYVRDGKTLTALALKEVILSAGAYNSPQLLILSGIGPQEQLQELGIPTLENLPVGKKLYDHVAFLGLVFTVNQPIVSKYERVSEISSYLEYIANGTGPLTSLGGIEALQYMNTKDRKEYPNIELLFSSSSLATDRGEFLRKTFRISDEIYNAVYRQLEQKNTFQIIPILIHPKSSGFLKLRSRSPFDAPKIYGRLFTDRGNEDIKTLISSIRAVQRLIKAPAFRQYDAQLVKTPIPGCSSLVFDSDNYWECALRSISTTFQHQVATCKMGPRNDPEAVVDSNLKVYGVKNLRIADSSVIPIALSANTNAAGFMIGEKAADLLKEEWIRRR